MQVGKCAVVGPGTQSLSSFPVLTGGSFAQCRLSSETFLPLREIHNDQPRLKITVADVAGSSGGGSSPRKARRRRRRLQREDPKLPKSKEYLVDPFLERQQRLFIEQGKHLNYDVERLKMLSDNKFELILDIAEEATEYLINNPEDAIINKPISKVISDRVNDQAGASVVTTAYTDATHEFLEDLGENVMH